MKEQWQRFNNIISNCYYRHRGLDNYSRVFRQTTATTTAVTAVTQL